MQDIEIATRDGSSVRLKLLKERHTQLNTEADELSSRKWLSSKEQLHLKTLKVLRLRAKDAIEKLQKEMDAAG